MIPDIFLEDICDLLPKHVTEFDEGEKLFVSAKQVNDGALVLLVKKKYDSIRLC